MLDAEGGNHAARPRSYVLTAVLVIACLLQYLDEPRRPGLWKQAHFVNPDRFFDGIQALGVAVA